MKEKFNTKYIASVSEYDIPLTDDLHEKLQESIDEVTRANQDGVITKFLKKPGKMLDRLNKAVNSFSRYAKDGPTGVLVGYSSDENPEWIDEYETAKRMKKNTFTYKGKRYPITRDIENLVSKLNPFKRNKR